MLGNNGAPRLLDKGARMTCTLGPASQVRYQVPLLFRARLPLALSMSTPQIWVRLVAGRPVRYLRLLYTGRHLNAQAERRQSGSFFDPPTQICEKSKVVKLKGRSLYGELAQLRQETRQPQRRARRSQSAIKRDRRRRYLPRRGTEPRITGERHFPYAPGAKG